MPDSLTDDILWLVCNRKFADFRALVTAAPARVDRFPLLPVRRRRARRDRRRQACARCRCRRPSDERDELRRPPRTHAQLLGARAAAISRPSATRSRSRTRARRRCRASPRCARSPRAASRRRCCRRRSGRDVAALRALGFAGRDADVIAPCGARGARAARRVLVGGGDVDRQRGDGQRRPPTAADGRVHFTPANLVTHFHRALEAPTTTRVLRAIFADDARFVRARSAAGGAAVRRRGRGEPHALRRDAATRRRGVLRLRPPRRSAAAPAPHAIRRGRRARRARRSPAGTGSTRRAWCSRSSIPTRSTPASSTTTSSPSAKRDVPPLSRAGVRRPADGAGRRSQRAVGPGLSTPIVVREDELPLADAVATYLFNSQLLARPDGRFLLVAPARMPRASRDVACCSID